ncbi:smoothelin [Crotalus adamanteus]|uniref:Smoothelin n=1 Tax=Crotalus adamanteus TaxID=8729 RepID=A0AAW1AQD4_CROAD
MSGRSSLTVAALSFQMEAELPRQPKAGLLTRTEKGKAQEEQKTDRLSAEALSKIEEEDVLDKMLDQTRDFEERRLIRAAMRDLRQRKRDQRERSGTSGCRSPSQHGSTKTQRLVQSNDGSKASRTITMEASYTKRSGNGNTFVQTKSYSSSSSKKVGSILSGRIRAPGPGAV